ncbi:Uncharacterised protein [Morganella morganii]|nr:Uncharacterised protein [Morganella morganii]
MDENKSIELLKKQQELIPQLKQKSRKAPEFDEWKRDTRIIIKKYLVIIMQVSFHLSFIH